MRGAGELSKMAREESRWGCVGVVARPFHQDFIHLLHGALQRSCEVTHEEFLFTSALDRLWLLGHRNAHLDAIRC